MKVQIISTKGMFTQAVNTMIPVWTVMHEAETIPAAADWLHANFWENPEALEHGGVIMMEIPHS